MPNVTFGQIYGRSFPGADTPAAVSGPSEVASGPDMIEEISPSKNPAYAVLIILGALTALRLVWEFATE